MTLRSLAANTPSRRANWRALGLSLEDMEKPKIAVVNSSSELAICYAHLDGIARIVKEEIRAAGGIPFEVRTAAPSDFITGANKAGIAAERDQREIARVVPALDGNYPQGSFHVGIGYCNDPTGKRERAFEDSAGPGGFFARLTDENPESALSSLLVQGESAAKKMIGIDPAKDEVRIRDGRPAPAEPVAGRTGRCSSAFGPHSKRAAGINAS